MDIDECKNGQWPNIAIDPRTGCHAVTGEPVGRPSHPIQSDGLRTACYEYERRIDALKKECVDAMCERDRWIEDYDKLAHRTQELVTLLADGREHAGAVDGDLPISAEYEGLLARKQRVIDVQRESFRKVEADVRELGLLARGMWRAMDAMRMAGRTPDQAQLDGWAERLAAYGIEAE